MSYEEKKDERFEGEKHGQEPGSRRGSGRKGGKKRKDFDRDGDHRRGGSRRINDPSWTIYDKNMLDNTASFNYGYPLGMPIEPIYEIPGMARFTIFPIVSELNAYNSATNMAFRSQYIWMRNNITGNFKNYDWLTLAMVVIAISEVHVAMESLRRLYKVTTYSNPLDRYAPKGIIEAMGYDPSVLEYDRAKFRAKFDTLCTEINKFPIPDIYNFRKRWKFSVSNVFRDGLTAKSQLYFFDREGYYLLKEGGNSDEEHGLSQLRVERTPYYESGETELMLVENMLNYISTMIEYIANSSAVALVVADIIKAYPNNLVGVSPITDSDKLEIQYNTGIQSQIHNCDNFSGQVYVPSLTINQVYDERLEAGAYLHSQPTVKDGVQYVPALSEKKYKWISLDIPNPTPEDTMYATRLAGRVNASGEITCTGLEVVNTFRVYTFEERTDVETGQLKLYMGGMSIPSTVNIDLSEDGFDPDDVGAALGILQTLSCFDDHPYVEVNVFPEVVKYSNLPVWEINNFTLLDVKDLKVMQYGANLGAYNINPTTGDQRSKVR